MPLKNTYSSLMPQQLAKKICEKLLTTHGKTLQHASDIEVAQTLSSILKDEIMINWVATERSLQKDKPKILYYLCMEYLPGSFLANYIFNTHSEDLIQKTLSVLGRNAERVINSEPEAALGNGGLGRLASCLLDGLASQHYPFIAYGIRYQYGMFKQKIINGKQEELPETWLKQHHPWSFPRPERAQTICLRGSLSQPNEQSERLPQLNHAHKIRAIPTDFPILGYNTTDHTSPIYSLRLWNTKDAPCNFQLHKYNAGLMHESAENMTLSHVLYPQDDHDFGKQVRLKQAFLIASASMQDILQHHQSIHADSTFVPEKISIQINDTHPSFASVELIRLLMSLKGYSFDQALETTIHCCNYTNHTILKESLEEWHTPLLENILPLQYYIIQKISQKSSPQTKIINNDHVQMAHLAIHTSTKVNGVSEIHTNILKTHLFTSLHQQYKGKIINITNGVSYRYWLMYTNPALRQCITKYLGKDWEKNFSLIEKLKEFAQHAQLQKDLLDIKKQNKAKFLTKHQDAFTNFLPRELLGKIADSFLFNVQCKRLHEYKRQTLLFLHLLWLLRQYKTEGLLPTIPRLVLASGKSAPGYALMKQWIIAFHCLQKNIFSDPTLNKLLIPVFLENYNISIATDIIPATDLAEHISCSGYEASGTSNMKFMMNGALNITSMDGSNPELASAVGPDWWPFTISINPLKNSPLVPQKKITDMLHSLIDGSLEGTEEEKTALRGVYEALTEHAQQDKYKVLQDFPSYMEQQKKAEQLYANPSAWAQHIIHNLSGSARFSIDNTIKNYNNAIWGLDPHNIDPSILTELSNQQCQPCLKFC